MKESKQPLPESPPKNGHEDIERRLEVLEDSLSDLRKNHMEGHKWFTTVIFSLVALLLTTLGINSRTDVREAVRDMKADVHQSETDLQTKVASSTADMEKKFLALAGEAIKKPSLEIAIKSAPLNGQELQATGQNIPFYPLFIKNVGNKRSDSLSVRLYTSTPIGFNGFGGMAWLQTASSDREFPYSYWYAREGRAGAIDINPQETWTLEGEQNSGGENIYPSGTNRVVDCELRIYYGVDSPSVARFRIKFLTP
jgi:hypothetical protein